jgi:hypothetical protein
MRHNGTVCAGKGSEVVVESMIFFEENDNAPDRTLWRHQDLADES